MTYLIAPLLLILLYLFMILPALPIRRTSDHLALRTHYAHRGYHDRSDRPENSLAAFRAACELGYGIELDIHLTADGQIVVFHDDTAERMCGDPRRINDCTYEELSLLRLKDSNESIPLFSDVLSLVDGQVPLLIEFKLSERDTTLCERADALLQGYSGDYAIQSFNPLAVRWYKKHRPDVLRGQLSSNFTRDGEGGRFEIRFLRLLTRFLMTNLIARPHFISYNQRDVSNVSLRLLKGLFRVPVAVWTINSAHRLRKAFGRFDIMIFEEPEGTSSQSQPVYTLLRELASASGELRKSGSGHAAFHNMGKAGPITFASYFATHRHAFLFGYFLIYLPWFFLLEKFVKNFHVIHVPIDDWIPFIEYFIIPYLLWFFYVAATLLYFYFTSRTEFFRASLYLFSGMTIFLLVSTLYPTGHLLRPTEFARENICTDLVRFLYHIDTSTNILPSIHVFNSLACHVSLAHNRRIRSHKFIYGASTILCISILISTVCLKQHSVADVASGCLMAYLLYLPIYDKMPRFLTRLEDRYLVWSRGDLMRNKETLFRR